MKSKKLGIIIGLCMALAACSSSPKGKGKAKGQAFRLPEVPVIYTGER